MDSILGNIKKLNENKQEESIDKKEVLAHYSFEIDGLESNIKEYLEEQTYKLQITMSKAYTNLGKIFLETQKKLSHHHKGIFEKWYTALGFSKKSVYRYIDRYKLIELCQNDTTQNLIESLPISLACEIASPNCPDELRNDVFEGKIKTLKEFKELKMLKISSESKNIIDVTPIDFDFVDNRIDISIKRYRKLKKKFESKELNENQIKDVNKSLEKIENEMERLSKKLEMI